MVTLNFSETAITKVTRNINIIENVVVQYNFKCQTNTSPLQVFTVTGMSDLHTNIEIKAKYPREIIFK